MTQISIYEGQSIRELFRLNSEADHSRCTSFWVSSQKQITVQMNFLAHQMSCTNFFLINITMCWWNFLSTAYNWNENISFLKRNVLILVFMVTATCIFNFMFRAAVCRQAISIEILNSYILPCFSFLCISFYSSLSGLLKAYHISDSTKGLRVERVPFWLFQKDKNGVPYLLVKYPMTRSHLSKVVHF